MTDSRPLVWLPWKQEMWGDLPAAFRYEFVDLHDGVPDNFEDVEVYVPAFGMETSIAEPILRMKGLRYVQTMTAGAELVRPYVSPDITLCNGRGIHDAATAELAVGLALAALRDLPRYVHNQSQHVWDRRITKALADSRVMIVGYGSIGGAIERRLEPFEVEIVRVARTARDNVHAFTELPTLLPDVDVVILITPLTDETRGLVDAEFLAQMKDGALLVNVARGGVVVTEDLVAALETGRIHAALDVTDPEPLPSDHPLWDAPNTLIVPHIGGATYADMYRARNFVVQQLGRYASGEPLLNVLAGDY